MAQLQIYLCGTFQVKLGSSQSLQFKSTKDRALLAYLAAEASHTHSRESLAALFWPDMPDSAARSNLRYTLSSLRRTIRDQTANPPYLLINQDSIQFNTGSSVWVDLHAFQEGLPQSKLFDATCTETAVSLFQGPFLAGFSLKECDEFEAWLQTQRQRLNQQAITAYSQLAAHYDRRHEYNRALHFARRQVELEPWDENAQRQLLRLLAFTNQRGAALAHYTDLCTMLNTELGVTPEPETIQLADQIRTETLRPEIDMTHGCPIRGYELGDCLGMGHMGTVYSAFQPGVGRNVAIKIIKPDYADQPEFIRRFELEAHLIARLEHPHIVPLYDFWREPGGAFLVMRWLRGGSLADSLRQGPWTLAAAARLIRQIAAALQLAHQNGVIHCDIKPANILLDEAQNGYLSDFGIATLSEPQLEVAGFARQTGHDNDDNATSSLGYTSPELLRGQTPTTAADIYSLGIVLFELLAARHPFQTVSAAELTQKHLNTPLPALHSEVDAIIQRATAKQPEARYPDALALAYALQHAVGPSVGLLPGMAVPSNGTPLPNPYKGLRAFTEAETADFFGREAAIAQLLHRLEADEPFNRFLAVIGPSGSGKSSLLRAGLLPRLRQGALPGAEQWYAITMTPGDQPISELALGLLRIAADPQPDLSQRLRRHKRGLLDATTTILPPGADLLLTIDQFEELYTHGVSQEEREQFLQLLYTAVTHPHSQIHLLIGLRADFYDRPLTHPAFSRLLQARTEVIVPLTPEEVTAAIEEPARRVGVGLEDGLTAVLTADVAAQPGGLPLLQHTLAELFAQRNGRLLTHAAYQTIGGVAGSLAQCAENTFQALDSPTQHAARQTFLRLVVEGENHEPTRRRLPQSELIDLIGAARSETILQLFGQNRLLTFDRDPATRQPTVEIAHEALLRAWERLTLWLDESQVDLHWQRILAHDAAEWQSANQDDSYLLRGSRMAQLEEWAQKTDLALTANEQTFIAASLTAREERRAAEAKQKAHEAQLERRSRQRLRAVAAVMAAAAIITTLLSVFAWQQRQAALQAYSLSLSANAQTALKNGDTATALVLALAANENNNPPLLAQQTLLDAAYRPGARRRYLVETLFPGVQGSASALALSPDGQTLFIGFADGTIVAWDWVYQRENGRFTPSAAPVNTLATTTDGLTLLSGSADGQVIAWDVATGQPRLHLVGHSGDVRAVDISQDGRFAISGAFSTHGFDAPGELFLWDLSDGALVRRFESHLKGVIQARFVLSDTAVLAASGDLDLITDQGGGEKEGVLSDILLWDVTNGEQLSTLAALGHDAMTIAPLANGTQVLIGSYYDNVSSLFDLDSQTTLQRLEGHNDAVTTAAVNPDGSRALTGSKDGILILWNLASGQAIARLGGHNGYVTAIAATPDFRTAFSISRSGEMIRWDLTDAMEVRRFTGHGDMVYDVAVMPDGQRLVSVSGAASPSVPSRDTSLRVWDIQSGVQVSKTTVSAAALFQVDVSADGRFILAENRVFNAATLEQIGQLTGHAPGAWIPAIAISPDGRRALTGSTDEMLIEWDLASQQPLQKIALNIQGGAWAVAYSPDGRTALAGSSSGMMALWDLTSGQPIQTYLAPGETPGTGTSMAAFHPDGQRLYGTGSNVYVDEFDLENGNLLRRFGLHNDIRTRAVISENGRLMLTSGLDGTLRLWDLPSGDLVRQWGTPGNAIFDVTLGADGNTAFSGFSNGSIVQWNLVNPSLDELRDWIAANRFVRDLSCQEQALFQIVSHGNEACVTLTD